MSNSHKIGNIYKNQLKSITDGDPGGHQILLMLN